MRSSPNVQVGDGVPPGRERPGFPPYGLLKIFVDDDARYSQFLCPTTGMSGISQYRNTCP
jgi:hypothetical protein